MNAWKLIPAVIALVTAVSIAFQLATDTDDVRYPVLPLGATEVSCFYSPTSALVEMSFMGQGDGSYTIIDLDENKTLKEGKITGEIIRVVLPHPGYYGVVINGSYSGSATIRAVDVGFPTQNWRAHFLTLSLAVLLMSLGFWREKDDWAL
ncbi:hypothetical protein GBV73_00630 [Thermococcus sp. 101 C5]|mgnify:CR=1 FL=1|jgi:hypothetical protein|uniref:hypothetical protein n=1 Tax=unclassified Thermococcus TaxID=2627626 RepID=UPI00128BE145|nr:MULTISPECIES: hypothetical protein [unclassified Thermococcus]MDK2984091.1 hypothetical protein [Thermococcaceae archaeon]MPW38222.1 hypothetical protein [Thermococcus sp. 101 C5]